jgi:oligopeptide transport system permease protein
MNYFIRFLLLRTGLCFISLFVIATTTFLLMKSIPGDPFQDERGVSQECIRELRHFYGLDQPLYIQYGRYVKSIFCFDFGPSLKYPAIRVNDIIREGFPISATLGAVALAIALPFGILFGLLSAFNHGKWIDSFLRLFAVGGVSIPSFVMACLLQFVFAFELSLLPIARFESPAHMVLPAITLAIGPIAIISRLLRASTLDVLAQQYIYTARMKGLSLGRIISFHVLKNASLPVLSYLGPVVTNILVGSFIVERVFAIPGLGQWFVGAVLNRDYPLIGGLTVFYSIVLIIVHSLLDLLYTLADPRIRLYGRS